METYKAPYIKIYMKRCNRIGRYVAPYMPTSNAWVKLLHDTMSHIFGIYVPFVNNTAQYMAVCNWYKPYMGLFSRDFDIFIARKIPDTVKMYGYK